MIEAIIKEIDEMIAEMKQRIDPNPQWERDLYYGKGYIEACEVIKEIIDTYRKKEKKAQCQK